MIGAARDAGESAGQVVRSQIVMVVGGMMIRVYVRELGPKMIML